jgi:hypothetical protein
MVEALDFDLRRQEMILEEKEMGNMSCMGWINQCKLDTYLQSMSQTKLMASDEPVNAHSLKTHFSILFHDRYCEGKYNFNYHPHIPQHFPIKQGNGVRLGVIQTNHALKELQSHSVCIEQGDLGQVLEHLGQVLEATCHSSMKGNNT